MADAPSGTHGCDHLTDPTLKGLGTTRTTKFESDRGEIACKEDICRTIGHEDSGWQPRARL